MRPLWVISHLQLLQIILLDIDFVVMLAAPGIKGSDLLAEQAVASLVKEGISSGAANAYKPFYLKIIQAGIYSTDTATAYTAAYKDYLQWKQATPQNIRAEI